ARVHVVGRENIERDGGFLLAANHISHFDPLIISSIVLRKIDWMAMAEFFGYRFVGFFLRAVDAFPAERDRADLKTIRTAIARLKQGRIVGLFPEGGIRDGAASLLEGAPLRPGASALAQIAQVPIVPCVILGSDRFYAKQSWLSFRSTPVWIGFGSPILPGQKLNKTNGDGRTETDLASAFLRLYSDLRHQFRLGKDDLPQPPKKRMARAAGSPQETRRHFSKFSRLSAFAVDSVMCASMNLVQSRHRLNHRSKDEFDRYLANCEKLTVGEFYAAPLNSDLTKAMGSASSTTVTWQGPIRTRFPLNDTARADFFPSCCGPTAPTVLMLHALMSVRDNGYRRCAARFNELGWNACFVHLPYHYSRVPQGHWNGELAITADLMRNAEGLRQGVIELRQLMAALREHGCREFGVLGASYGAWIGALLATLEADFRFVALMAPIVNVEHALWDNRATAFLRRELKKAKIEKSAVARHFHLSSPLHNDPLCPTDRILLVAGDFDIIARPTDIERLHQKWQGSELLRVPQGHFGYRMLRATMARLKERGL
ncbi:MAG: hypothetical protein JWO45_72, partial [Spartobacteria bacterium]|nr:hypothetical protein [Spartobacteria bacterium]